MTDSEGWTALHYSARLGSYESVKFFADMGTDINLKTSNGKTCLHIAALYGHLKLCKKLINIHKFDVHMADNDGWIPLHHSTRNGNSELVTYFADIRTKFGLKTNEGRNCLHIAALYGHMSLCKTLIDKYKFDVNQASNTGLKALHYSAVNGSYELVRYFADMGTDIECKNNLGWNCLHIAARNGHLDLCKTLIDKEKFDLHITDDAGYRTLHHSAKSGNYKLLTYFVDKGTDIYLRTVNGRNCLHIAAQNGHLNLCKALIDKYRFNVHVDDRYGYTALHHSARSGSYKLLAYFIDMGTDIHLKTKTGINCLHLAAENGYLDLCKALIDNHKFDLHIADNDGYTALHFSVISGNSDLVTYFAEKVINIKLKTKNGSDCLHIAVENGHLNLCKMLINKYMFDVHILDNDGCTVLHQSARSGSYDLFRYFVKEESDIHLKTKNGRNCLHIAAFFGHLNLCKILIYNHRFNVNMADKNGCTALHHSAVSGKYELFTYFADKTPDIHVKTNTGLNCLHIAALSGHLDLCKTLIDNHKFDVDISDIDGCTALHHAVTSGKYDLVAYLANKGTDVYLKTKNGRNCLHIAAENGHLDLFKVLINKHEFDVHIADNDGCTALHHSAVSGNHDVVTYFADNGIDIYLKTKNGRNCLHIAAANGHLNLCKTLIEKHRFKVNIADNDGCTALHHSARSGSYELVTYFVNMGSDIRLKTKTGLNCLHIGAENGHLNLCKMIVSNLKFDVNIADNEGYTALHHSARSDSYDLVTYFVHIGTDIYLKTKHGINCLHIAAFSGYLNLCKTLIDNNKFDVHIADNEGYAALHYSARTGSYELMKYFFDMGTDIYCKTKTGLNCLHIAALSGHLSLCKTLIENHGFDVSFADNDGCTALHHSVRSGSYELFTYFANEGVDIHLKTKYGRNCLHLGAVYGSLNLCKKLIDNHKFDLHITDDDGCTALHHSARNGSYELINYFVSMGADIHLKTKDGLNCLHMAALFGHLNLSKVLVDKHKFSVHVVDKYG